MAVRVERKTYTENGKVFPVNIRPQNMETVRVKTCGNIKEVMYTQNRGHGAVIRKLNKTDYVDTRTGEVKKFEKQKTRKDDKISLSRSLSNGRDYINANVTEPEKCRWITLTYAENMQDEKKLDNDWKNFRKKLNKVYGHTEFISAAEPQARGAWHLHVILIFPGVAPFIENKALAKLWGHGFVKITRLQNVDNVGAYLTAYLGDIPLDEYDDLEALPNKCKVRDCEYLEEDGTTVTKRVIKGGRLHLYPAGMHIFRNSRGCKKPEKKYCSAETAEKEVSGMKLTYETTKFLTDEATGFSTVINYRFYNKAPRAGGDTHDSQRDIGTVQESVHENQSQIYYIPELFREHRQPLDSVYRRQGSGNPHVLRH